MQRRIETLGNKCFPDIENRLRMTSDNRGNFGIRFIGMKQDIGVPDCGGSGLPTVGEPFKERSLVVGKVNGVLALPHDQYLQTISI